MLISQVKARLIKLQSECIDMEGNTFREIFDEEEREMLSECVSKQASYFEKLQRKHYDNRNDVKGAADRADSYKEKAEKYNALLAKVNEESF
jgi:hypothetical protein